MGPSHPLRLLLVLLAISAEFTVQTIVARGKLPYVGVGREIDGVINPDFVVQQGTIVRLVLQNGDGMPHDLYLPDFDLKTTFVSKIGDRAEMTLQAADRKPGTYVYYCTAPGHCQAGQEGRLVVLGNQPE